MDRVKPQEVEGSDGEEDSCSTTPPDMAAEYARLAAMVGREAEAEEWSEAFIQDLALED